MFENTFSLCRHILRRDRLSIIFWFLGLTLLVVLLGIAVPGMYTDQTSLLAMAETLKMPSMIIMLGPVYDGGGYTVGALYASFMLIWTAAAVCVMNIFLVVRHTRQDEESGRTELIRALPSGRLSSLSSVLIVAAAENLALALLFGLGLGALNVESMSFDSTLLFGLGIGAAGFVFAAATAVFCQLMSSHSTATGSAFAFLGITYFIRAAGDVQGLDALSCLSPLGLLSRTRVFAENRWWPVAVLLAIAAAFAALSFFLCAKRDTGAGLVPAKNGKPAASGFLSSAPALAVNLLKTPFIIWTAVIFVLGLAYGSILGSLDEFISTNEIFKMLFPDGDPAQFISYLNVIMSFIAAVPVLQFALKARTEEKNGYAENVLVLSVSRHKQLLGYFLIALASSATVQFMTALGFYLGGVLSLKTPIPFSTFAAAAFAYLPAFWFMIALSLLLIAFLPRQTFIIWVYLGFGFLYVYMGSLMDFPDFIGALTPFYYIPKLPSDDFSIVPLLVLTLLSAAMTAAAFYGFRRRDMVFN